MTSGTVEPSDARSRTASWAVLLLAALFVAAHLPSLPPALEEIDSVNYALGVRDYDVAAHQPHPPGSPVFIALGKLSTAVAALLRGDDERRVAGALAFWGVLLGGLAAWPLFMFFRSLDANARRASLATLLVLAAPLYWFNAVRPLNDVPGLAIAFVPVACFAAAFARQGRTARTAGPTAGDSAASGRLIVLGAFAAGLAIGVRAQTILLTLPLFCLVLLDRTGRDAAGALLGATLTFGVAVTIWAVPMLVVTGPTSYWTALTGQIAQDWNGLSAAATQLTLRALVVAAARSFVLPWSWPPLAAGVCVLAAAGAAVTIVRTPRAALVLLVLTVPSVIVLLPVESAMPSRYALPLLPALAYLAVRGAAALTDRAAPVATAAIVVASLIVVVPVTLAYGSAPSPLRQAAQAIEAEISNRPGGGAVAMHHEFSLALRDRAWLVPPLPAPAGREWLQLAAYWETGNRRPVHFLANQRRTDLALVDPASRRLVASYDWPFDTAAVFGRARPHAVAWHVIDPPGWVAREGWALTPETAGRAALDGRSPAAGIDALVRRRSGAARLMVGGRHLGRDEDPAARFEIRLDDEPLAAFTAGAGFFLRFFDVPAGGLDGAGDYAVLRISSRVEGNGSGVVDTAVEQFDLQPASTLMWGFGDGWHEMEYDPALGRTWRWTSAAAALELRGVSGDVHLRLRGESPLLYFETPPAVSVRVGGTEIARATPTADFAIDARIPAQLLEASGGTVTIESDGTFVPALRGDNPDPRVLGLKIFSVQIEPAHR